MRNILILLCGLGTVISIAIIEDNLGTHPAKDHKLSPMERSTTQMYIDTTNVLNDIIHKQQQTIDSFNKQLKR